VPNSAAIRSSCYHADLVASVAVWRAPSTPPTALPQSDSSFANRV
jgi:hypothetical protein